VTFLRSHRETVEIGYMSHTARRSLHRKEFMEGRKLDGFSRHGRTRSLVGAHLRRRQLPKGEMFRTIGDTRAATVLGLMVEVLSLSISSSLTT